MAGLNPKSVARYRAMEALERRCGACLHYVCGPGTEGGEHPACDLVAGEIVADMVCDLFSARRASLGTRTTLLTPPSESVLGPLDMPTLHPANGDGTVMSYAITKADEERRYTFGPLYLPDTPDAHNEYVAKEDLQQATWNYVRKAVETGSNIVYRQHTNQPAGEWVEIASWPFDTTVQMQVPGTGTVERTFPAGTVYQGVVWQPDAWEDIKKGRILGLSMGGMAVRATPENLGSS